MATDRPPPLIRGQHVWLRATERSDIPIFVRWFNDVELSRFVTMNSPLSTVAEERWFERMVETQGTDAYHFVICLLEDDRPIGTIGLFRVDAVEGSAGMGISIGEKSLWGKGYGSDALLAILDFAFGSLRMERVWLDVYDHNTRAIRSYEKCGFVHEGTKRHAVFQHGRYGDVHLMSILRAEWDAHPHTRSWDYPLDETS